MNPASLLLIGGILVLAAACRTLAHPIPRKLGAILILAASFLAGYLPSNNLWLGAACAATWFLLPWLEILTRIRKLRMPSSRRLTAKHPPRGDEFPGLEDLTAEVTGAGFEHLDDVGWDWEDHRQFLRVFEKPSDRVQAAINLVEQGGMAFYFLSLWSRTAEGKLLTTWNYPFSSSLKTPPDRVVHWVRGEASVMELLDTHALLVIRNGITTDQLVELDPEALRDQLQQDLQAQIAHNVRAGVLRRTGDGRLRYSLRGMFYLWFQFIRDLLRYA